MSRIEDDRDAARMAEKLRLQKREQEQKVKDRQEAASQFSRLVQTRQAGARQVQQDTLGKDTIAHLVAEKEESARFEQPPEEAPQLAEREQAREKESRARERSGNQSSEERVARDGSSRSERSAKGRLSAQDQEGSLHSSRSAERSADGSRAEGRKGDAKVDRERLEERKEGAQSGGPSKGAAVGKGELKAEGDGRGGKQQGGGKDSQGGGDKAPGFRLNPALMAPVAVAQARTSSASERLRALANEIAQKIVERVRVGTNAAGKAEFQIELRSNVLAGLTIKVSGSNGRIQAVFSGRDREVLKLLTEQSESLKAALTGRGLVLEEFRVEVLP